MKLLHTSDWHLGRVLHGHSLLEDQAHMLNRIIEEMDNGYDAVIVAGDVFDRAIAPAQAMTLLNNFLKQVKSLNIPLIMIPGNHDSMERLGFGAALFESHGLYLRCSYEFTGSVTIKGNDGVECDIFTMPFVDHAQVRNLFPDEELQDKESAIKLLLNKMERRPGNEAASILVAHEFVAGADQSESERVFIGGSHMVASELFDGFSYVALGHLHKPQKVGSDHIRYCGSPLAYSFGEVTNQHGMLALEISPEAEVSVTPVPLTPLRKMSVIEDSFENLMSDQQYVMHTGHYISARITDPGYHHNIQSRLRERFPHLLEVRLMEVERRMAQSQEGPNVASDDPQEVLDAFLTLFNWEGDDREAAKKYVAQANSEQEVNV